MSKDIQVIANDLGAVPEIFKNKQVDISAFTAGIQPSFPVVSIKAGHWGVRFGGETTPFTEADPRAGGAQTAVSHLDVVLIAAASTISKSFYAADYQEGSNEPPTCWSSDGVTPDASILAENKQNPICASCPRAATSSAWRSRVRSRSTTRWDRSCCASCRAACPTTEPTCSGWRDVTARPSP